MDSGLITEEVHPTQKHKRAHTSEQKRTHTHKRSKSTHTYKKKCQGAKKKKMGNGKPPAARQLSLKDDRDPSSTGESSEAVGTRNRNGEVPVLVVVRRRMYG